MKCPVCDKEHIAGDPCRQEIPPGFIGIRVDLCKIPKFVNWISKKVKRWKTS